MCGDTSKDANKQRREQASKEEHQERVLETKQSDGAMDGFNQSVRHGFELFYLNNIDGRCSR